MAVCTSCGAENPAGFRFCGSCGTALGMPGCPSCGFSNPPGQRFCGQCGTELSEEAAPARTSSPGERKLATVLFGDAVNVAARLEKAAGGGEVLVGPLTAELAADGVLFRERQPVILKGKRDPVPVCEVLGLRREAAPTEHLPLVGREDELAFLRA